VHGRKDLLPGKRESKKRKKRGPGVHPRCPPVLKKKGRGGEAQSRKGKGRNPASSLLLMNLDPARKKKREEGKSAL